MAKSEFAKAVDAIQLALRPLLKEREFRVRGRTFNRSTKDGLTHVVNLQMGPADPPGTTPIPGLRENLHGLFTVNLGVYVPEVARHQGGAEAGAWVQEYACCIRCRLGEACGEQADLWWVARSEDAVVEDVRNRLESCGLTFLDRFASREMLLEELAGWPGSQSAGPGGSPPRIVMAIVHAGRGELETARDLLARQAREARNPGHATYVAELAQRLGVGSFFG